MTTGIICLISQLKDSNDIPVEDSEEKEDEEMEDTIIKTFRDAIPSLEEVQTFLSNHGYCEIFESLGNVIDSVASISSKSCAQ